MDDQHEVAFYFGLNAALLSVIVVSLWLTWPLQ